MANLARGGGCPPGESMRSRQGARCRCNGTDFVPDHLRRTTRFGGKVARRWNCCPVRL